MYIHYGKASSVSRALYFRVGWDIQVRSLGQSYKLLRNEDTVFALQMPRPLHGLDDNMKMAVVPLRHEEVCFLYI